jgi:hypothetical protein
MTSAAAGEPGRARADNLAAWMLSAALAALAATFHIRQSLDAGALALPPTYDDVGYFVDAARRLNVLREQGLVGFLRGYAADPPHSPLSTLLALAGFALFGVKPWAACAATALPLAILFRAIFAVARDLPVWIVACIAAAMAATPMTGLVVVEFRPDALCALATAAGAYLAITRRWADAHVATCVGAGSLFGFALWSKPSLFPLTVALLLAVMAIAGLAALRRSGWKKVCRAGTITASVAAAIAAPHYVAAFDRILSYFMAHFAGRLGEIWHLKITPLEHALYYVAGPGGNLALGSWTVAAALVFALVLLRRIRHRNDNVRSYAIRAFAVVLLSYALVSTTTYKTPFIGVAFAAMVTTGIALGAIAVMRSLIGAGRIAATVGLALVLLAFSLTEFATPWARHGKSALDPEYVEAKNRMAAEMVEAVHQNALTGAKIVQAQAAQYMNESTIAFLMVQRRLDPIRPLSFYLHDRPEPYRAALDYADAAIAFASDAEYLRWLPSSGIGKQFLSDLNREGWLLVRTIGDRKGVGPVYLFRRSSLGETLPLKGFGPVEGPYPQWGLPKVRWGLGSESAITASGRAGESAELVFEVRAPMPEQSVAVTIDGAQIGSFSVPNGAGFRTYSVRFVFPTSGKAVLGLAYARPAERAVLYRRLRVSLAAPSR